MHTQLHRALKEFPFCNQKTRSEWAEVSIPIICWLANRPFDSVNVKKASIYVLYLCIMSRCLKHFSTACLERCEGELADKID